MILVYFIGIIFTGTIFWLIDTFFPTKKRYRMVIKVIVSIIIIFFLLEAKSLQEAVMSSDF